MKDYLMHYGRKGMQWGKNIFAQQQPKRANHIGNANMRRSRTRNISNMEDLTSFIQDAADQYEQRLTDKGEELENYANNGQFDQIFVQYLSDEDARAAIDYYVNNMMADDIAQLTPQEIGQGIADAFNYARQASPVIDTLANLGETFDNIQQRVDNLFGSSNTSQGRGSIHDRGRISDKIDKEISWENRGQQDRFKKSTKKQRMPRFKKKRNIKPQIGGKRK